MTDLSIDASVPDLAPPSVVTPPSDTPDRMGARDAGRLLASLRKPKQESKPVAAEAPAPAPVQESSPAEDAAPPQEAPGETQEADPAVEQPSIEPPRSWTKEAKERWQALPRDTQEYLAAREQERERELRRGQNEAAEARKAIEAERVQAEQARQKFESALPQVLALLQHQASTEFADIQSEADVDRLAREDWPRYIQWQRHREKAALVVQQMQTAQQQQQTEAQTKLAEFVKKEGELFMQRVPEMADPVKAAELQKAAVATLESVGFDKSELAESWARGAQVSFHDHRVQLMIHKAALWDQAQAKAKTVVNNAKPLPPVQRPGVGQPKGAAQAAQIEILGKKLDGARNFSEGAKIAAQMLRARRTAR